MDEPVNPYESPLSGHLRIGGHIPAAAFIRPAAMTVCGFIFALVNLMFFFPFWYALDWCQPVSNWATNAGLSDTVVSYWPLIWSRIPDWLVASILGIIVGLCASPSY
jgi:hypothetical protein